MLGHARGDGLSPLRSILVSIFVRPFFRVILFAFGFYFIHEAGEPVKKAAAPIMIANHVGGPWEAMYLLWRAGAAVLAEGSNVQNVIVFPIFEALQGIIVDRQAGRSAGELVRLAIDKAAHSPSTPPLLIFPEGTCSNGTALLAFKTGAFAPRVPVQAVAITYPSRKVLDVSWVSVGPGLGGIVLRLLSSFSAQMSVRWLSPMVPKEEECGADGGLAFMRRVRGALSSALGVPPVGLGLDDVQMGMIASRAHLDPQVAMVELASVRALVNVSLSEAKSLVKVFVSVSDARGRINYEQFVSLLASLRGTSAIGGAGAMPDTPTPEPPLVSAARKEAARLHETAYPSIPQTPEARAALDLRRLFHVFDVDGDGELDARELIVGLALLGDRAVPVPDTVSGNPATAHLQHLHLAFLLLCDEGEKSVSLDRFARVLHHVWPDLPESRVAEIFKDASEARGCISEEAFKKWVSRSDVFEHMGTFRDALLGLDPLKIAETSEMKAAVARGRR